MKLRARLAMILLVLALILAFFAVPSYASWRFCSTCDGPGSNAVTLVR